MEGEGRGVELSLPTPPNVRAGATRGGSDLWGLIGWDRPGWFLLLQTVQDSEIESQRERVGSSGTFGPRVSHHRQT